MTSLYCPSFRKKIAFIKSAVKGDVLVRMMIVTMPPAAVAQAPDSAAFFADELSCPFDAFAWLAGSIAKDAKTSYSACGPVAPITITSMKVVHGGLCKANKGSQLKKNIS